jgi:hypothetical protein
MVAEALDGGARGGIERMEIHARAHQQAAFLAVGPEAEAAHRLLVGVGKGSAPEDAALGAVDRQNLLLGRHGVKHAADGQRCGLQAALARVEAPCGRQ